MEIPFENLSHVALGDENYSPRDHGRSYSPSRVNHCTPSEAQPFGLVEGMLPEDRNVARLLCIARMPGTPPSGPGMNKILHSILHCSPRDTEFGGFFTHMNVTIVHQVKEKMLNMGKFIP